MSHAGSEATNPAPRMQCAQAGTQTRPEGCGWRSKRAQPWGAGRDPRQRSVNSTEGGKTAAGEHSRKLRWSERTQVVCGRRSEAGLELRASSSTPGLSNLRQVTSFTQASGSFTRKVGGISYLRCFPSPPLPRPTVGREYSPYAIDDGRSHTTWFGQWNVHGSDNGHVPVSSATRKAHRGELLVQEQGDTWGSSGRGPQPDTQQYQPMGRPMSTDTKSLHPGLKHLERPSTDEWSITEPEGRRREVPPFPTTWWTWRASR